MLEYDIQLFFRRAKAWPALFGEPGRGLRAGRRAPAGPDPAQGD